MFGCSDYLKLFHLAQLSGCQRGLSWTMAGLISDITLDRYLHPADSKELAANVSAVWAPCWCAFKQVELELTI